MTTVTAVKRAVEEALKDCPANTQEGMILAQLAKFPTALTVLANRLSDRGRAGNDAAKANLETLRDAMGFFEAQADLLARMNKPASERGPGSDALADRNKRRRDALEWAIDQLTPPELAKVTDSPTAYLQQMGRAKRPVTEPVEVLDYDQGA